MVKEDILCEEPGCSFSTQLIKKELKKHLITGLEKLRNSNVNLLQTEQGQSQVESQDQSKQQAATGRAAKRIKIDPTKKGGNTKTTANANDETSKMAEAAINLGAQLTEMNKDRIKLEENITK